MEGERRTLALEILRKIIPRSLILPDLRSGMRKSVTEGDCLQANQPKGRGSTT